MSRPFKPFSNQPWVVGRDFPDPNTRPPVTVPQAPTPTTTPPPAPPTTLPPPAPPQSAAPPAPIPAAQAQPQQSPTPKPRETRPAAAKSNLQPPTSNLQNSDSNLQPQASNFHSGKCSICNHPDRAEIEAAFLNWEPAERIVAEFKLPARSTLYRHAKAADLLNQRRKNLHAALDHIIEQAGRVPATASSVISAIELSCRLSGGNIAPLRRYEVTHKYIHEPNPAPGVQMGGGSHPPGVRPQSESNLQPLTSNLQKQSGHLNIVAEPNLLIPKEGHDKQSGHIGGT